MAVGRFGKLVLGSGLSGTDNGDGSITVDAAGGAPSGAAGGALDGSYPNPGIAASVAGAGLSESSNVLAVNVDGSTLEIASDTVRVKADGITANEIAANAVGSSELAATTVGFGTTRLWDAATGAPVGGELVPGRTPYTQRTLPIDHFYPSRPAFAPNGDALFTPVVDGSVVAWDLRPSSWVRAACDIVGRDLTRAQWRQYVGDSQYHSTCSSG